MEFCLNAIGKHDQRVRSAPYFPNKPGRYKVQTFRLLNDKNPTSLKVGCWRTKALSQACIGLLVGGNDVQTGLRQKTFLE